MVAAEAIRHRHLPNAGIQRLLGKDVLHWVVCLTLYRRIRMAIKIASDLPAFFVVVDFVVGHNRS